MQCKINYVKFLLILISAFFNGSAQAQIIASYALHQQMQCVNADSGLIQLMLKQLPVLLGQQLKSISTVSYVPSLSTDKVHKILWQIDQKDQQGRYILPAKGSISPVLSERDELLIRKRDLGQRIEHHSPWVQEHKLIEIEIINAIETISGLFNKHSRWFYIELRDELIIDKNRAEPVLVYNDEQDSITSSIYKIYFSKKHPFLVEQFHWYKKEQTIWGANVTDSMKIRHTGRFLGLAFKRSQDDYDSTLVGVKAGALRIIRRTENRIKVLWRLKSPVLFIDYVLLPNGFVMDTMVDIPFKLSYFFSELATITTMDWRPSVLLSGLRIAATDRYPMMPVSGLPSTQKKIFNDIDGQSFSLLSQEGQFNVALAIPDDFPIHAQLYLRDDLQQPDPPENYPGQLGNIGFKTTGWENIDRHLYHLTFTVCLQPAR